MPKPRPLLTELSINRARPRKARYTLPDGPGGVPGFGLTVQPSGSKSYSIRVRIGAEQPRLACGRHPVTGLAAARSRARALLQAIERGEDPRCPLERPRDAFAAVVGAYTAKRLKPRLKRWRDVEAVLRHDAVRAWADRPIQTITKRDVRDLLDDVAERAPVSANRLRSYLNTLFKWAIRGDYCTTNPVEGVDLPHTEIARDRLITNEELPSIWQAWLTMGYPFGILGRLLLLSGARRSEWAGASWAEIDLHNATWLLPARRAKSGREHLLPLSDQLLAVLGEIPRFAGTDLLFPASRVSSVNPISGYSKALQQMHRLSNTSGWHFHDLRRCCRSGLARLGVSAAVGERILCHNDGTASRIAAIYDRHTYQTEMRQALVLWASELERIVGGGERRVVPLQRSAGGSVVSES